MEHKISDNELLEELKRRFEQNKNAVKELKSLNDELKTVNKKLEESEAMKSHFISNITNEIINPFTSILGLSRAILSVDKENWKKVVSMVALIHSEAFTLDFQFRNIFVAAKIEAGEVFPEILNVDVENLIEGVIESFKLEARKKKLHVNLEFNIKSDNSPYLFKTDPEKLKLILANLLSNAINFSFEGGVIDIVTSYEKESLVILVRDHGIGISKENQKVIFDRFKRLDSGINSLNRGHGLGLSVNKAIIEMLNGHMDIKSELGKGACFTIHIPETDIPATDFASDANETFFDSEEETF
ncbi:MAG TPA: HAMP domain-containing sensor histidine kinase [Tenuifilaceae bacterium]|nr:HAMP domain-containing sensor histidine kinase [Tenuifilaceae bacterium]HPE17138.1 HAMP domain-containing sensor histidine kinase [Tenuifilaceae bacterium]HPJ45866.1 HAMP domain-containing sensor histidine kinase [Tenuifilaceae bacterium]HPQ34103.1 HAMP domain-containing sensor histidine kinase [Tenuifilaceae bacterium]HRX68726.1 HAMP domain-containing sensor histidine kinase [Tenuifilaceae bacterium]